MRQVQEPKIERRVLGQGEVRVITHPAFAQISAQRVSGNAPCYGSDFNHQGYIEIEIVHSELHRDLGRDFYNPRSNVTLLRLSDAQWAGFVASAGTTAGVPCTLEKIEGKPVPEIPSVPATDKIYKQEAEGALADAVARLKRFDEKVSEMTASLNRADQQSLYVEIRKARADLEELLPFIVSQQARHMEERVEKAKVEIATYATATMQRLGIDALQATRANMDAAIGSRSTP